MQVVNIIKGLKQEEGEESVSEYGSGGEGGGGRSREWWYIGMVVKEGEGKRRS